METGQLLIDKRRAWRAVAMVICDRMSVHSTLQTAFINAHHDYFLQHIIYGDKQTFLFGFRVTNTSFTLCPHFAFGIGRVIAHEGNPEYFASNTMGQRHPVTGAQRLKISIQ